MPATKLTLSADAGVIAASPAIHGAKTAKLIEIGRKAKGKFPSGKSYKVMLEDSLAKKSYSSSRR